MKQCDLAFAEEKLTEDLARELWPLLKAHRDEVSVLLDVPLCPDWEAYKALDKAGILRAFTARTTSGYLAGYAVFLVTRHLHYSIISAMQDILYLSPEFRRGMAAKKLLDYSEKSLAYSGVEVITQHSKQHKDLSALLTFMKYKPMDLIWYKRL